jgi:hypothetical protein
MGAQIRTLFRAERFPSRSRNLLTTFRVPISTFHRGTRGPCGVSPVGIEERRSGTTCAQSATQVSL